MGRRSSTKYAFERWTEPKEAPAGWGDVLAWQRGRCAFCGYEADLVVDHDHGTGLIRGSLCHGCNVRESGGTPEWQRWNTGETPAQRFDVIEVYCSPWGGMPDFTTYDPQDVAALLRLAGFSAPSRYARGATPLDGDLERAIALRDRTNEYRRQYWASGGTGHPPIQRDLIQPMTYAPESQMTMREAMGRFEEFIDRLLSEPTA